MKSVSIVAAAVVVSFLAISLKAAEDPAPEAAPNGKEMPLDLYRKLKGHFDNLYGAKSGLLPGVQPMDKAEVEKELKSDAAANKAVLVKALGSSQSIQRELAARALEYCGDKAAAVEALATVVADDADESVRRAAAAALAKIPDAAAQDSLIKALGDSVETVRALSARALGNIKDSHSTEALVRALNTDTATTVRMQAAIALKKIKDPNSLDALKKALDSEKDENVKIAIAGAVREMIGDSSEVAEIPSGEQAGGVLTGLANDMKSVESKLRDDRHDQAVQADGEAIEKKLVKLIEQLEKSCSGSCKNPGEKKSEQEKKQEANSEKKDAKSGKQDSSLAGNVPHGATNAALVTGAMDPWAKLPPAQRAEMLQIYSAELPARWKQRMSAYILSVNAAENAENSDK